jgi:hypothetical protein
MPDLVELIGRILTNVVRINALHDEVVRARTLAEAKAHIIAAVPALALVAGAANEAAEELRKRRI